MQLVNHVYIIHQILFFLALVFIYLSLLKEKHKCSRFASLIFGLQCAVQCMQCTVKGKKEGNNIYIKHFIGRNHSWKFCDPGLISG